MLVVATALLVWGLAATAWGKPELPSGIGRPAAAGVVVERERIHVECKLMFDCRFFAQWSLHVAAPTEVTWVVHRGNALVVRVDGHLVDPVVADIAGLPFVDASQRFAAYRVAIARAGEVEIDVTGTITPHYDDGTRFADSVMRTRHALLHLGDGRYTFWFGDENGTAPREQEIVVDYPGKHRLRPLGDWSVERRGSKHFRTRATGVEPHQRLRLLEGGALRGGPLLAIGSGWTPRPRFRMRAGGEISSARFLVHSAVVETDFRRRVLLVPATEIASGSLWLIPSFAAGVGAPVQVHPSPRVGVRAQATISWFVLSFVGTFDAFPRMRGLPVEYHGGFYVQFSL